MSYNQEWYLKKTVVGQIRIFFARAFNSAVNESFPGNTA